ncbi:MAG TPA: aminoacyl-tRNA hydrolase [Patescibacteria group bacterium]|nr:aminoacyl-tRNA hydrolase [Patescibacteria group bacterium]
MKLIIGLGNPGEKYEHTRHNFGFMVVEQFLKDFFPVEKTAWSQSEKLKSDVAVFDWQPKTGKAQKVILAKPLTFMNDSGLAVSLLASFYKVEHADIWVVYDELDLPVGAMKIRKGGAAAGHHGVESIIEHLKSDDFWRFRMGIGVTKQHQDSDDEKQHAIGRQTIKKAKSFVLATFGKSEQGDIRKLIKHGADALQMALEKGMPAAMNRYNTK